MSSEPRRDPVTDPLLTSENSALIVIDFQPNQLQAVASIDHDLLTRNTGHRSTPGRTSSSGARSRPPAEES